MNPYNRQDSNFHQSSDKVGQNTLKQHPPVHHVRPPQFPSSSFQPPQDRFHEFFQSRNPVQPPLPPQPPPNIPRQLPQTPELRPKGTPIVSNWNAPPPPHYQSSNPAIDNAIGRPPNRFPPSTQFGKEVNRYPVRETTPASNVQYGAQQSGQPFTSLPDGFHGMSKQSGMVNPQQGPHMHNMQTTNFRPPHNAGFPGTRLGINSDSLGITQPPGQPNYSTNQGFNSVNPGYINNSELQNQDTRDSSYFSMPPPAQQTNTFQGNVFHHLNQQGPHHTRRNINSASSTQSFQYPVNLDHTKNLQSIPSNVRNSSKEESTAQCTTEDQTWLMNWLRKKKIQKPSASCTKLENVTKLNFPQARSLVRETVTLIGQLKCALEELKEDGLHETKKEKINHAEAVKVRLEEIKSTLNNIEVKNHLSMKLEQRRKMRERKKRKQKFDYEAKLEDEAKRKQKHAELDKWQQGIYDKVQDEKREKELKTIADKTLQEVNRKMTDVNKSLQILEGLTKLREVRKDSMQRKGLYPPKHSGPMFEARLNIQKEAVEKQKKVYEAEKGLLEVMLKTEQEECQEYEEQEMKRNKEEKEQEMEQLLREHLFGKQSHPEPGDPMYVFWLFYNAASQSPDGLYAIREQWDYYLVNEGTPGGSSLPSTWVLPGQPSSDVWASVLKS